MTDAGDGAERSADERARIRRVERHTAASLRALADESRAEYKSNRVLIGADALRFASPYLVADVADTSLAQARGIADGLALRLRFSDSRLHREQQPDSALGRIVFDILEQLRCESLAVNSLAGVRTNLDHAFDSWCSKSRSNGFTESELGILLYTIIHMVRARLIRNLDDEDVAAQIEATRANLSPIIGTPFYHLSKTRYSQVEYAVHAREIAETLASLVADEGSSSAAAADRQQIVSLPPDWDAPDESEQSADQPAGVAVADHASAIADLASAGDYHVFSKEFDEVTRGNALYREPLLRQCRSQLDQLVAAQSVSVNRLALRLQRLFASSQPSDWFFGQEEGLLDARRLSQLVANPAYRQVFYQNRMVPECDVVVSFLVDTSGSMKTQRYEAVAVLLDTFARALDLAGVKSEVLGFTTKSWNGGKPQKLWRRDGMPDSPGRLSELQHIVYKDAESTWRQARNSIAAILRTDHYREGVDGEALLWAWERLLARPESRRYLVMISDGSPMESATANANGGEFLLDHLTTVARHVDLRSSVHLGCIGIDLDTSFFITNSVSSDLTGTLGNNHYRVLESLFGNIRH